jgi:mevalonate kinase
MYIDLMENYRIKRTDKRNIVIQRKRGQEWRTISYHGNSTYSLVSGLFELIVAQHTPTDEKLLKQLKTLELEIDRGLDKIKGMIEK